MSDSYSVSRSSDGGRRKGNGFSAGPYRIWELSAIVGLGVGALVLWRKRKDSIIEAAHDVAGRIAAEKTPKLDDLIESGFWGGLVIALILLFAVVLARPLWRGVPGPGAEDLGKQFRAPLWFWAGMIGCCVVGGIIRWERTDVSIYNDEAYTLRRYSMGDWEKEGNDPARFHAVDWRHTAFSNRGGNNHVLFTLASRLSLDIWRERSGGAEGTFDEAAVRLPAFIAGVAGIAALGLALAMFGKPDAGLFVMVLASVHPWHVRYGADARGYGFILLFVPLLLMFAIGAVRSGALKWWLGYAGAQFALMSTFLGSIYFVVALNAAVMLAALFKDVSQRPRHEIFARLVVANVFSLALFFPLMGPSLPQVWAYLQLDRAQGNFDGTMLLNAWCYLAAGMPWGPDAASNPLLLGVVEPGSQWQRMFSIAWVFVLLPTFTVAGAVEIARSSNPFRMFWIALLATAPLACLHVNLSGSLLYYWYLTPALPGLLICCGMGVSAVMTSVVPSSGTGRAAGGLAMLRAVGGMTVLAVFVLAVFSQTIVMMHHSRTPTREVAQAVRAVGEDGVEPLSAVFWTFTPLYDPDLNVVWNAGELAALMLRAAEENRPLVVGYGHRQFKKKTKESWGLLELAESELFSEAEVMHGIEEDQYTHYVRRMKVDVEIEEIREELVRVEKAAAEQG